jgi:DNA-binding SARP family transcriptional activator
LPVVIVCRTLGPVEVQSNGALAPPELLWRKNLALLVYLARSPRRSRSREHLMGLLWGDKPESAARHSLNEAMRVLRQLVGESSLETVAGTISLAAEAVRLDVEELDRHISDSDWCAAAQLATGEFMEGFAVEEASGFEDWLTTERAAWRSRSVEALVHCAEAILASGQAREAVALARRASALDPRSEIAARMLIRGLVLAGERAAAIECYQSLVKRLAEESHLEPDPETVALIERVRRQRPAPQSVVTKKGGLEPHLPLIGRSEQLTHLLEAAGKCIEQSTAVAIVMEGDAGTGKTRLLEELLGRLRLDGAVVAAIRAVEGDQAEPLSGVRALGRGGLLEARGLVAAPGPALAAFTAELSEWAERFHAVRDSMPMPLGRALAELLRSATEEQPVFLAVDDAEWLDRASALALEAVLRDLQRTRVGVILTTSGRTPASDVDRLRARIGRDLAGTTASLNPLRMNDLRDLARHFLSGFDEVAIDRLARRVAADSAGIPLLAVELLRAVALGMDLGVTSGAWPEPLKTLDQTLPGDLPSAVVAAIRVGFGRLSRRARDVLAAASILDDRVPPELLARALDITQADVTEALDELEWQRWLVSEPRGYEFTARIVRQVIARDMLTPGQRRRTLERLGRAR